MNPRTRSMLFSFFFTFLVAGAVIYILKRYPMDLRGTEALYKTSDVKSLTWVTPTSTHEFSRADAAAPWSPLVVDQRLEQKLHALAQLIPAPEAKSTAGNSDANASEEESPLRGRIDVTIGFFNGSTWSGHFDGGQDFVWTTGPRQGQSARLTEAQIRMFQEGQFAFDALEWKWCLPDLRRITFEFEDEAFEIEKGEDGWELVSISQPSRAADQAWLTSWIERACSANVQAWIDLTERAFGIDDGRLAVEALNSQPTEYPLQAQIFQVTEKKAAYAPELFHVFDELMEVP